MKVKTLLHLGILLVIGVLAWAFSHRRGAVTQARQDDDDHAEARAAATASPGNPVAVAVGGTAQRLAGLEAIPLPAASRPREFRCYGRVLDASPLVGLLGGIESARATLDASSREHDRMKLLFEQGGNASARAFESAGAAARRDRVALEVAEMQLVSSWGRNLAESPDLPGLARALARLDLVLVRLELAAADAVGAQPLAGRVIVPGTGENVAGRWVGPAASADPQLQGRGYLLVVTNASSALTPGLVATGYLQVPGEPLRGVAVPESAVVRAADRAWVFVQEGSTNFVRREIRLEYPHADGWLVTEGVGPGDRVVVTGAQVLLSEQRRSEINLRD